MTQSQSLLAGDVGISPTHWQKSRYPSALSAQIEVVFDGIDCDIVKPNPGATFDFGKEGASLSANDEVIAFVNPDRTADIPQFPLGRYQNAMLLQPAMGMLEQLVEGEGFGGVLSHPRFNFCPVTCADRRHAKVFAGPGLMLLQCLVALIKRAKGGDRRGGKTEPLADIAQ